jgi:microcystin-dependent protein
MPLSKLNTKGITSVSNTAISGTIIGTQLGVGITGQVCFFAFSTIPTGWLKANGASISRTAYANLFAVIGTSYGVGDGSTTFVLPDLRGEFLRSFDDSRGVDSGRSMGSAQSADNQSHEHNIVTAPHTGGFQYESGRAAYSRGYPLGIGGPYSHIVNVTGDGLMATGVLQASGTGSEARPRNVSLLACIKF